MMLAGDDCQVKPDRMLCRFVADAADRPDIPPRPAREAVVAACRDLARDFNAAEQDIFPAMILVGMLAVATLGWATTCLLGVLEQRLVPAPQHRMRA